MQNSAGKYNIRKKFEWGNLGKYSVEEKNEFGKFCKKYKNE